MLIRRLLSSMAWAQVGEEVVRPMIEIRGLRPQRAIEPPCCTGPKTKNKLPSRLWRHGEQERGEWGAGEKTRWPAHLCSPAKVRYLVWAANLPICLLTIFMFSRRNRCDLLLANSLLSSTGTKESGKKILSGVFRAPSTFLSSLWYSFYAVSAT